jgi:hypothetical protein
MAVLLLESHPSGLKQVISAQKSQTKTLKLVKDQTKFTQQQQKSDHNPLQLTFSTHSLNRVPHKLPITKTSLDPISRRTINSTSRRGSITILL